MFSPKKSSISDKNQLEDIIQQINDHRDKAIIDLIAKTGIYLDELKTLTRKSLSDKDKVLKITGKRKRTIKLSDDSIALIKNWVSMRPKADHDYLFTSLTGKFQPLSSRGVDHILRKWSQKLNVDMNYLKLRNISATIEKQFDSKKDAIKQLSTDSANKKRIGLALIILSLVIKLFRNKD